ncbi:hypothetical protein [Haloferax sp. DFSO60]
MDTVRLFERTSCFIEVRSDGGTVVRKITFVEGCASVFGIGERLQREFTV